MTTMMFSCRSSSCKRSLRQQAGKDGGDLSHQRAVADSPRTGLLHGSHGLQPSPPVSSNPGTLLSRRRFSSSSAARATPTSHHLRLLPASLLVLLIIISLFTGSASATFSGANADHQRTPADLAASAELLIDRLLVDRSEPPEPPLRRLLRRDSESTASIHSSTTAKAVTTTPPSTTTTRRSASTTATTLATSATSTGTSLPVPFDTNLGSNFTTSSCPAFFNSFLSNSTFQACHPLSLLLQNSNSFFDASKSFVRITQTLDATCNVNFSQCLSLMQTYANQIISPNNCEADYNNGNAMVVQAYHGLLAYEPLFKAGCLRDTKGNYCFAGAITNKSSVADSYPYYLPLGVDLPGSSRPTCNYCLQETMTIFNSFAGNSTQPVSKTYVASAQQINIGCGPSFVNTTVVPLSSAATALPSIGIAHMLGLVMTALFLLL